MVRAIFLSTNNLKKSIIGAMLVAAPIVGIAQNKQSSADTYPQSTEIMPIGTSDSLKIQTLSPTIKKLPNGNIVKYDLAGRIVKEYCSDDGGYYVYEYNDNSYPQQDIKYSSKGELEWSRFYFYNSDGLESEIFLLENTIVILDFDKKGNIIHLIVRDEWGNIINETDSPAVSDDSTIAINDASGNKIELEVKRPNIN